MHLATFASVVSLGLLGLIGGSLVLAQDGFTTSSRHGTWSVFVPAPQAYLMAAILFALSALALVWILQQVRARPSLYLASGALYGGAVVLLTRLLARLLH
ncbi:MAG: hypothetical protein KDG55_12460 [Rhodocyclaceae bacterium]|nr:hypothetical protein [Rhodocyclaceae bacterium]